MKISVSSVDVSITPEQVGTVASQTLPKSIIPIWEWTATCSGQFSRDTTYSSGGGWAYAKVYVNGVEVASKDLTQALAPTLSMSFTCSRWDYVSFRAGKASNNDYQVIVNAGTINQSVKALAKNGIKLYPKEVVELWELLTCTSLWFTAWERVWWEIINSEISTTCGTGGIELWNCNWFLTIYNPTDWNYYKIPVFRP